VNLTNVKSKEELAMANYNLKAYLTRLDTAGISYEKGAGDYKGDYFVTAGQNTPHLHLGKAGNFVGLKKKRGAMTTLVESGGFKIDTIQMEIDELKDSTVQNDQNVKNALLELARQNKE
jgi:hypothetical protein